MKKIKIVALISGCFIVLSLGIFGKSNQKVSSETSKVFSYQKTNPTITAILKRFPQKKDFEEFFSRAVKGTSRDLKDYFIIKDTSASEDSGYAMLYKYSDDASEGSKITDKDGNVIDNYKIGDNRGAWMTDILNAYVD